VSAFGLKERRNITAHNIETTGMPLFSSIEIDSLKTHALFSFLLFGCVGRLFFWL
jgi:hypothetical protein